MARAVLVAVGRAQDGAERGPVRNRLVLALPARHARAWSLHAAMAKRERGVVRRFASQA